MKKIFLFFACIALINGMNAQITYDNSYSANSDLSLVKLHVSGYKYLKVDVQNLKIELYNVNHSLLKVITIPTTPFGNQKVLYVSENLFDNDNMVEFALTT